MLKNASGDMETKYTWILNSRAERWETSKEMATGVFDALRVECLFTLAFNMRY